MSSVSRLFLNSHILYLGGDGRWGGGGWLGWGVMGGRETPYNCLYEEALPKRVCL